MRIAILDLDGTLIPGTVGHALLDTVLAADARTHPMSRQALEALRSSYASLSHTSTDMADLHVHYAQTLAGCPVPILEEFAQKAWRRELPHLFAHTRPLIALLRDAGFRILLLSGSPEEIVRRAAAELRVDDWRGTRMRVERGAYTREFELTPALPGGKLAALTEMVDLGTVNLARSFALGNSWPDADLLHRVGLPVVFEPSGPMADAADWLGFAWADRHTLLKVAADVIGSGTRQLTVSR
jgi:HAD superfamily phosphoserine phosphatase-like hydrolase